MEKNNSKEPYEAPAIEVVEVKNRRYHLHQLIAVAGHQRQNVPGASLKNVSSFLPAVTSLPGEVAAGLIIWK